MASSPGARSRTIAAGWARPTCFGERLRSPSSRSCSASIMLSMSLVEVRSLPRKLRSDVPAHPLPVALVGRLAVDQRAQGRGIGGTLLTDALLRVAEVADQVGCYGVTVDAKDESAMAF